MKTIQIPETIYEDFLIFLDVAQSGFTEEEIADFSEGEQNTLEFVEKFLKKNMKGGPSKRFDTKAIKHEASKQLTIITERR